MQGVKAEKGKTHAARDGVNGVAEKRRVGSPLPDGFEGWGGRGDGEDGQNPLPVKKRRAYRVSPRFWSNCSGCERLFSHLHILPP